MFRLQNSLHFFPHVATLQTKFAHIILSTPDVNAIFCYNIFTHTYIHIMRTRNESFIGAARRTLAARWYISLTMQSQRNNNNASTVADSCHMTPRQVCVL